MTVGFKRDDDNDESGVKDGKWRTCAKGARFACWN